MSDSQLTVHVQPRAKSDEIVGFDEIGRLRVRVRAAPSDGAATDAVVRLLAKTLGLAGRQVTLEHGQTSRTKRFCVDGMGVEQVRHRLQTVSVV